MPMDVMNENENEKVVNIWDENGSLLAPKRWLLDEMECLLF